MASFVLIVLLQASLTVIKVHGDQCNEVTLSVRESSATAGCTNTTTIGLYQCSHLQSALQFIGSATDTECHIFYVQLETGVRHVIREPISTSSSVHITSSSKTEEQTVITCDYNVSEVVGQHTIYFNQSNSVTIINITMEGCPLPLRLLQVQVVEIENSVFQYFSEAVFDIHNCINVIVTNCHFLNNYGTGIILEPIRGNTGALAISYNNMNASFRDPKIIVSHCDFINNLANATIPQTTNYLFSTGVFTGRGGAMGVFVNDSAYQVGSFRMVYTRVINCTYIQNYASQFSSALYVFHAGLGSHNISIEDCQFNWNYAGGAGGLVFVGTNGSVARPHTYYATRCHFEGNKADVGSGLFVFIDLSGGFNNVAYISQCAFINNEVTHKESGFGAAMAVVNSESYSKTDLFPVNHVSDCTFISNVGNNSIVSIGSQTFNFSGTIRFISNQGPALRIIDTRLIIGGQIEFINNSATVGAALMVLSFSQIRLLNKVQMLFEGNTGRFGSSIFVETVSVSQVYEEILFNPMCFLLLESNRTLPPSQWGQTGINITFTKNSALFAPAILASSLMLCSWYNGSSYDVSLFPQWPIFDIRDDNMNTGFQESITNPKGFVGTNAVEVVFSSTEITAWPGEKTRVALEPRDELKNPAGALARFTLYSFILNETVSTSRLIPNTFLLSYYPYTANITYAIEDEEKNKLSEHHSGILGRLNTSISGVLTNKKIPIPNSIDLTYTDCIGGYSIQFTNSDINDDLDNPLSCSCDHNIIRILECEHDRDSVIIKSGQWSTYVGSEAGNLFFYYCPPGYCQCFLNTSVGDNSCVYVYVNTDPDRQCVCGRKGVLCGECENSKGVSALLNNCVTCSNGYIVLIPLLVIIDIIVMIVIILVDVPLPEWSYSCLFYIQIAPIFTKYYPETFSVIGKHFNYISSGLSLYFPYDFCLYNEMSAFVSYGLKFTPAIIAIIVVPITLFTRRLVRIKSKSLPLLQYHGIWTIILLLYPHTLYTAMSILHCPRIPDANGQYTERWYYNGSVQCFREGHLPLSIIALFVILMGVLVIPILIILSCKHKQLYRYIFLYKLSSSLKYPYRGEAAKCWCGVELGQRLLCLLLVTVVPRHTLYVLLLLMILFAMYGYIQPYKTSSGNYLNAVIMMSFMILFMIRASPFLQESLDIVQPSSNTTILTSIPSCDSGDAVVTPFSMLLAIVYYIPLLIAIVCVGVWVLWAVIFKYKRSRNSELSRYMDPLVSYERAVSGVFSVVDDEARRSSTIFIATPLLNDDIGSMYSYDAVEKSLLSNSML